MVPSNDGASGFFKEHQSGSNVLTNLGNETVPQSLGLAFYWAQIFILKVFFLGMDIIYCLLLATSFISFSNQINLDPKYPAGVCTDVDLKSDIIHTASETPFVILPLFHFTPFLSTVGFFFSPI